MSSPPPAAPPGGLSLCLAPARPSSHAPRQPAPRLCLTVSRPGSKGCRSDQGGSRDVISSTLTRLTAKVTSASPAGRRSRPYASPLRRHHPAPPPSPPPTRTDLSCAALSNTTPHTFLTSLPTLAQKHHTLQRHTFPLITTNIFIFRPAINFPLTRLPPGIPSRQVNST